MKCFYRDGVLSGKIEVSIVFESELVLAFHHTQPFFEHHIVIIPKEHIDSLSSDNATDFTLASQFLIAINHVVRLLEDELGGCRVCSNVGDYQSAKHLHWYVHAGERLRNEDGSSIRNECN